MVHQIMDQGIVASYLGLAEVSHYVVDYLVIAGGILAILSLIYGACAAFNKSSQTILRWIFVGVAYAAFGLYTHLSATFLTHDPRLNPFYSWAADGIGWFTLGLLYTYNYRNKTKESFNRGSYLGMLFFCFIRKAVCLEVRRPNMQNNSCYRSPSYY